MTTITTTWIEMTPEDVLEAEARERAQGWADPDEVLRRAEIMEYWSLPELDYYHVAKALIAQGLDWRNPQPASRSPGRPSGSTLQDVAEWAARYRDDHGGTKADAARAAAAEHPEIEGTPSLEPWERIHKAMRR